MTLALTIAFGVLFFLAIMACVALHEVGHMLPAKLFGVKVPKYFVGFGKTLWSMKRGDTEYGIKVFPLGGFVQLLGMYPPRRPGAPDTKLQRFADEAREAEWDDITPADAGRLFYERSTPKKLVMMAGGITMNLLIAFLLTWGVTGLYGVPRSLPAVSAVEACVITTPRSDATCTAADPLTPAARAGLARTDVIVAFNGTPITSNDQLTALIRANLDQPATIVVQRNGQTVTLPTVNTMITGVEDPLVPGKVQQAGFLGYRPVIALVKGGPGEAVSDLGKQAAVSVEALVQLPVKVFNVAVGVVTGAPRDLASPISVVGASAVAGEVATADVPTSAKVAMFVSLLASVNLFLALFNLVPLPPLDGGHIAGALYEAGRRQVAKLRGKPDPGPADTAKMLPVAYVVGGLVLIMGIVLIVADIVSPIKLF